MVLGRTMNRDAALMAFQGLQQKREAAPLSPVGSPSKTRSMGAMQKRRMEQPMYQRSPAQAPQQRQQVTAMRAQGAPQPQSGPALAGGTTYQTQPQGLKSTETSGNAGSLNQFGGFNVPGIPGKPSGHTTAPGSGKAPQETRTEPTDLEQLYEQSIREMLEYKRDPAAEQALIREAIEGKTGAELNDARAGMGRAGFGGSGAGMALEGDIMREAGLASSQAQLDASRRADLDRLDAMGMGLGASNDQRSLAIQEKAFDLALQMLSDETGAPVPGDGGGDPIPEVVRNPGKGFEPIIDALQPGHDLGSQASKDARARGGHDPDKPISTDTAPPEPYARAEDEGAYDLDRALAEDRERRRKAATERAKAAARERLGA